MKEFVFSIRHHCLKCGKPIELKDYTADKLQRYVIGTSYACPHCGEPQLTKEYIDRLKIKERIKD